MSAEVKEEKERKPGIPQKSSMEILSELFSTFHAEPPVIVKKEKSDESSKKHKKKKKHKSKEKKHKKKDKKKKRSRSGSLSSRENGEKVDLEQILVKQEKELAEIKIKKEIEDIIKKEKTDEKCTQKEKENTTKEKTEPLENGRQKIIIKDIKFQSLFESEITEISHKINNREEGETSDSDSSKKKKRHKSHSKKRSRSKSRDGREKRLKSEEKPEKKEKNRDRDKSRHKRDSSKDKDKDRHRDRSRERIHDNFYGEKIDKRSREYDKDRYKERYRDRSRDRYRDEYEREMDDYRRSKFKIDDHKRDDSGDKWFMRDRYRGHGDRDRRRSASNDRDSKIDKKKLLEIARKNAITMMKSGSLPAALTLGPQAQEKVIAAIKSGGKTIEELTDFCKTLSKKEELGELSSLSEKEDSDSDADKPFHHPFQIKDRPTSITMNIKNSVPLPVKSALERTGELRLQFPVSSGQHHRKGEEWMPVSPPSEKKTNALPAGATLGVTTTTSSIPLPIEPAPPVIPSALPVVEPPLPVKEAPLAAPLPIAEPPTVSAPPNAPPGPQVFPTPLNQPPVDIGSIVSQRLSAMRRLQENPNDVQALTQMYKSNKEMQSWATSKQQLGQFTGSTGAQIMSHAELSSGYQAWAKKAIMLYEGTSTGDGDTALFPVWTSSKLQLQFLEEWVCISSKKWDGDRAKG